MISSSSHSHGHRFLAPREDEKGPGGRFVFDCQGCDGTMSPSPILPPPVGGGGWWWRDAPGSEWKLWRNGAPCPNTRDRKAEALQKMIEEFRSSSISKPGPWDEITAR